MKILIVEDSLVYAKTLKTHLEKYLLHTHCDIVSSFEELKKIDGSYDLYVCDLNLPDSRGEHIEYLINKGLDVILMTSNENFDLSDKVRNGILDYVIKDDISSIEYLVNFVKRLIKNPYINILIAEDSSTIRHHEKKILQKLKFNVFEAKNGKEALEVFKNNEIDILITDLEMPNMDGLSLIKEVRKTKKMVELPIVVVSSVNEKKLFLRSLKAGANDYIQKPFEKEELILRVNNLVDLYDNYKKVREKLITDSLTGVYNRYYLENVLEKLFNNYDKKSIAMLDIDYFKKLNDTYGHQFGDEVLAHFARTIKENMRKSDIIVRYGGEEFLIFMPNTSKKEALIALLKVVKALAPVKNVKFTFSAGIADEGESLAEMIKIADNRLYKAKEAGRNRIVIE